MEGFPEKKKIEDLTRWGWTSQNTNKYNQRQQVYTDTWYTSHLWDIDFREAGEG